jgi:hypothetical protein
MKEVEINKQAMLSPHFSLGEMTKTSYHPQDGNIPSRVHFAVRPKGNRRYVDF